MPRRPTPVIKATQGAPLVADYFAELYVAGRLAHAGWNVYFPHRDDGFDFVIVKSVGERTLIRPVQVKGLYPTSEKTDKTTYGYRGLLSQTHSEMVLAIAYFGSAGSEPRCDHVAYMPFVTVRVTSSGVHRCVPASYVGGAVQPRRDYAKFFDVDGIARMESPDWSSTVADGQ